MNVESKNPASRERVRALFLERSFAQHAQTDRLFSWLMLFQLAAGVLLAVVVSPRTWSASEAARHPHLLLAVLLGSALSLPAFVLARTAPGTPLTRQVIAVSQALWSALLIHLTGGRIETHFHVFGSLAFLAFYRDLRVLATATVLIAADHLLRGLYFPQSIFGVLSPSNWRWIEHAGWVLFEDVVLVHYCLRGRHELREMCTRQVEVESMAAGVEQQVVRRTAQLEAANRDMETARAFLGEVYRAVPGALMVVDASDRIRVANDGARHLWGLEEVELVGQRLPSLFVNGEELNHAQMLERIQKGELPRTEQTCLVKGGANIPVLFSARLMAGADAGSFVCVALDIRERKKLETELHQKQKLESLGQLAAGIAHEINTPTQFVSDNTRFLRTTFDELIPLLHQCSELGSFDGSDQDLRTALELMAGTVAKIDLAFLSAEVPTALDDSLGGLERISEIVRAMKEFSHPGARGMVPVDLNHNLKSTATVARNEWKYVAEMEFDLAPDLPQVTCLPNDVNQVFLNMIVNAAHAIDDARKKQGTSELGRIRISTRQAGANVEVRISDTGCGIPPELRARVYDPFFTTKEVGKGTGQGLAISHNVIVERHGGRIELESEVGVGTTFIVSLPVEEASPAQTDELVPLGSRP